MNQIRFTDFYRLTTPGSFSTDHNSVHVLLIFRQKVNFRVNKLTRHLGCAHTICRIAFRGCSELKRMFELTGSKSHNMALAGSLCIGHPTMP